MLLVKKEKRKKSNSLVGKGHRARMQKEAATHKKSQLVYCGHNSQAIKHLSPIGVRDLGPSYTDLFPIPALRGAAEHVCYLLSTL